MFKVVPSGKVVSQIGEALDATLDHRVALPYASRDGRGLWFQALADELRQRHPGAAIVEVPREPDRIERAVLELASQVGPRCLAEVACCLGNESAELNETLAALERGWGQRFLVVDGLGALAEGGDETYDAGHAQAARHAQVHAWFERHAYVVTGDAVAGFVAKRPRPATLDDPPSGLTNGKAYLRGDLWAQFAPDEGVYNAALAWLALRGDPDQAVTLPAWRVRERVVQALPEDARDCLLLLGLHGRPISDDLMVDLDPRGGRQVLRALGLGACTSSGWAVDRAWAEWCTADTPDERAEHYRRRLVATFTAQAHVDDAAADRVALSLLEAHRHCVALGDDAQALALARYGWAVLIEEGKRRSRSGRYADAARLYSAILQQATHGGPKLSPRLRGYVRHYMHFNRAKGEAESVHDTERAYRESVDDWPENALFWSRLVRAQIYAGRSGAALTTLDQAQARVPDHPEKDAVLIGRTVRGLLRPQHARQYLVEAAWVWGDHQPKWAQTHADGVRLERDLSQGWVTADLALPSGARLVFVRPQRVRVVRSADAWVAELVDLQDLTRGASPRSSLTALVEKVRAEVKGLVAALAHTLTAEERLRKQVLLGSIDLIASGLDADGPAHVWVTGELERVDGEVWLRTRGPRELWFSLSPELAATTVPSDRTYLAEVRTGASGLPIGPVTHLEPAHGSPAEIWAAWRIRMGGDA